MGNCTFHSNQLESFIMLSRDSHLHCLNLHKISGKRKGKHESKSSVKRFEDIQSNNFFEGSYCFFLHHFALIFHCSSPSLSLYTDESRGKKRKMVTDKIPTIIFAYTLVWLKVQIWLSQPKKAVCPSVRQECQNRCVLVSTFKYRLLKSCFKK